MVNVLPDIWKGADFFSQYGALRRKIEQIYHE